MARIRTLKPEFWTDEKLSLLDPLTRLVFLGLISMADDAGRLVDNVKLLDGQLFPSTDDSCREPLDTLARMERIVRYRSDSAQALIQIANWHKHQRVDNPSKYNLPGPETATSILSLGSREDQQKVSPSDHLPPTPDLRPTSSVEAGDTARHYALQVTAAANRAALQKWHQEPWIQSSSQSLNLALDSIAAGIPLPLAVQRVIDQIANCGLPKPPRSIRYWLQGIVEPNTASTQRRQRTSPGAQQVANILGVAR